MSRFYNTVRSEDIKNKYFNIRENVFVELNDKGQCSLVNELLFEKSVDALDYIAIKDAYIAYITNEKFNHETGDIHTGTNRRWTDIYNMSVRLDEKREELFALIQNALARFEHNKHTNSFDAPSNNNPTVLKAIEDANRKAEQIIEEAKDKAKRIEREAQEEAERIVSNAKTREKNLVEAGESQKKALIDDGYSEKKRLIENISQKEYKDSLEKCIKEHFKEQQLEEHKIRNHINKELDSLIDSKNTMIDGMNSSAQNLHSSLMLAIDDTLSNLQSIQESIHNQINQWQRNLYKNELSGIAMCFMNLDKIILSMENKIASHLAFGDEDYHKELAEELSQSVKNLKILKNNFELNLAKNSIKLLIPKVGEKFNTNYHRADNIDPMTEDEDSFNGRPITAVSDAGLIRVLNSSEETMFRAIVTVEK